MATICEATGLWDTVLGSPPFVSREQYRATVILILCQMLQAQGIVPDMSSCTVAGLWNQVKGTPPFMSEEEFMATHISLLCQLANGGGGGGSLTPENLTQQGESNPPLDGSWTKPIWRNTVTGVKWINIGTVAAPDPEQI